MTGGWFMIVLMGKWVLMMGANWINFMVMGFTFKELPHCRLFKARVSKGKSIFTSTRFPVAKFAALKHVGELYGLPLIEDWTCTLHSETSFVISVVRIEHWQVVVEHVYGHRQLQCA